MLAVFLPAPSVRASRVGVECGRPCSRRESIVDEGIPRDIRILSTPVVPLPIRHTDGRAGGWIKACTPAKRKRRVALEDTGDLFSPVQRSRRCASASGHEGSLSTILVRNSGRCTRRDILRARQNILVHVGILVRNLSWLLLFLETLILHLRSREREEHTVRMIYDFFLTFDLDRLEWFLIFFWRSVSIDSLYINYRWYPRLNIVNYSINFFLPRKREQQRLIYRFLDRMWVEETLEILTTTDSTFFIIVKLMDIATNCIPSIITWIKDLIIIDRDRFRIQMFLSSK